MQNAFEHVTPPWILDCAEQSLGIPFSNLTIPLPSYINRVYELESADKRRFVIKFYRPGRWSRESIQEEHDFVLACATDEIPVVPPLPLTNHETLREMDGQLFALYPKRLGRTLEILEDEEWTRLGSLIGRMHLAGSGLKVKHRMVFTPKTATVGAVNRLLNGNFFRNPLLRTRFRDTAFRLLDLLIEKFGNPELMVLHGDCHSGNILNRPGEGMMLIDFDDMLIGPAIQDLWLLLPDYAEHCRKELALILAGYRMIHDFPEETVHLIEPLRAMRMIYFLDWCSRQIGDYRFQELYPDWGSDHFWQKEINDLEQQYCIICGE